MKLTEQLEEMICRKCNELKSRSLFYKHKQAGIDKTCKRCTEKRRRDVKNMTKEERRKYYGKTLSFEEYIKANIYYDPMTGKAVWINGIRKGDEISSLSGEGYIQVKINNVGNSVHRIAFILMGEPIPKIVDHINGIKTDNRWCNLRPATPSQNVIYSSKHKNKTGYKGVKFNPATNKFHPIVSWTDQKTREKRRKYLGSFETAAEAHEAYKNAIKEIWGPEWVKS